MHKPSTRRASFCSAEVMDSENQLIGICVYQLCTHTVVWQIRREERYLIRRSTTSHIVHQTAIENNQQPRRKSITNSSKQPQSHQELIHCICVHENWANWHIFLLLNLNITAFVCTATHSHSTSSTTTSLLAYEKSWDKCWFGQTERQAQSELSSMK